MWKKKFIFLTLGIFISLSFYKYFTNEKSSQAGEEKILNVCVWSDYFDPEIFHLFEKETGIKVNVDYFDSNEVLEAKLLSGKSGYDIVFASAWPYVMRLTISGALQKIQKEQIPNLKLVDIGLLERLRVTDPKNDYSIPFIWGTTGIGYNVKKIKEIFGNEKLDSWDVLFDPAKISKTAPFGVLLMDSPFEIFSCLFLYLKEDLNSIDKDVLNKAVDVLLKVRPYIRKFSINIINELANGNACLVQGWSQDIRIARDRAKEADSSVQIEYFVPKEGAPLWIDVIGTPIGLPHSNNAHIFINFLLNPKIMALVTNFNYAANSVKASLPFIKKEILDDKLVYPPQDVIDRSYIGTVPPDHYERERNRALMRIKIGH